MKTYNKPIYAIYSGDKFLTIGTLKDIAAYLNIGLRTVQSYKAKPYRYNYVFVYLGKEKDVIV